jgi:hypothetical protein
MASTVTDLDEWKAAQLAPLRLGTLELAGDRIRLHADCSLTEGAARTLAAQLLVKADELAAARGSVKP